MSVSLSPRLKAIVDALPLKPGMRVLEIGCGPGAAAREIARRIGDGHVLAIDRSAKAIAQARVAARDEIAAGRLSLRNVAIEDFQLAPGEAPYDIAVAVRVGALDGRHPELEQTALHRIASALTPRGRIFIDGGDPLREIKTASRASAGRASTSRASARPPVADRR
jgi:cyclopropane fatty-acyl-phospholipid synthase-like methyltransferase